MPSKTTLRRLQKAEEYEQCLELQRRTWGGDFRDLAPVAILMIAQKVDGFVAGAFDPEDRMVGFVFGLTGLRRGRLAHWSHMLAVAQEARGSGVGKALKTFQRRWLLERSVEVMYWSYDPLVARNANLNLNALGGRVQEYVRDMYGADTGSEVHRGLGTDRFVVEWELVEDRLQGPGSEREAAVGAPPPPSALVLAADPTATAVAPRRGELPSAGAPSELFVEIPADIEAVQNESTVLARRWREESRWALEGCLARGYRVAGFTLAQPSEDQGMARGGFYRLERGTE